MAETLSREEGDVLDAARKYATARADAEHHRVNEAYPHTNWRDAWDRAQSALSELIKASCAMEGRPACANDRAITTGA